MLYNVKESLETQVCMHANMRVCIKWYSFQ